MNVYRLFCSLIVSLFLIGITSPQQRTNRPYYKRSQRQRVRRWQRSRKPRLSQATSTQTLAAALSAATLEKLALYKELLQEKYIAQAEKIIKKANEGFIIETINSENGARMADSILKMNDEYKKLEPNMAMIEETRKDIWNHYINYVSRLGSIPYGITVDSPIVEQNKVLEKILDAVLLDPYVLEGIRPAVFREKQKSQCRSSQHNTNKKKVV